MTLYQKNKQIMIRSKQLHFSYSTNQQFHFPDIELNRNEHCVIIGPSGSGKTTFLHLLGGLLKAQSGSITINETDLNSLSATALDKFRGKNIGMVFQKAHLIKSISAIENLNMAQYAANNKVDVNNNLALLESLQIAHKAKSYPSELSIGEQQRLSIARALVNKPSVLLADEPSSSLDDKNAHSMIALLKQVCEQTGAALVVVTHDQRITQSFSKIISL
jgi:ABC-type lipoprotein export system ATPase subunit